MLAILCAVLVTPPQATAQPSGVPLVDETFTGATANAGFSAFGSACLTGAPAGSPGPGLHPLAGCPANQVGPVPPINGAPHGYLQLTDASTDQSGAVLYEQAIPATQGLVTTFDQWQYGSTTPATPADGISFFLIDGAASLNAPGAFGGSLGYAQKLPDDNPSNPFLPGVNRGYLGVGLDVLGNYFGDWEHRGNGCARRSPAGTVFRVPAPGPNMVTVRGPGDGTEGYCFLTATTSNFSTTGPWPSTLPGQLQGPTTSLPPGVTPAQAETLLEPSRRTVTVEITPTPDPVLTVSIDFHDGNGTQQVLSTPAPEPVPDTYKFGFAASTGLFTDVHLIRNVSVHSAVPLPNLNLVKQVSQNPPLPDVLPVGTQIPYEYVVTNSGTTPITNLAVNDDVVANVTCPTTTLAVGQTVTCTGTYVVTQADANRGFIRNTATATGMSDGNTVTSPPSEVTLPVVPSAGLAMEKRAETPGPVQVGDTVTYHYTVTNNTDSTVQDVAINDDHVTNVVCEDTTLAPGASTACSGTYVVTQADADAGFIRNTAIATATSNGETIASPPDEATLEVLPHGGLELEKTVQGAGPFQVGDTVTYHYTVTNNTNATVQDIVIDDDRVSGVVCQDTTLAPGASTTCTGTYVVTQSDADEGSITNAAAATGLSNGERVVSPPDEVTVQVIPRGTLVLEKTPQGTGPFQVGDTVTYQYTVTNNTVDTVQDIAVDDDHVSNVVCEDTTLAPGASTTCTGTYVVTQADADRGFITNTATATGLRNGERITSPPEEATVQVIPRGNLVLEKTPESTGPFQVGDTVTYHYTVTNNTSNTIQDIAVDDDHVSNVVCQDTTLAPGASTTCTGTYVVTQADADRGSITNTATATGLSNGERITSPPAEATVQVVPSGNLELEKMAEGNGPFRVGDTVTYHYTVTNNTSNTVDGIVINDDRVSDVVCEDTTLAPGASTMCTGTYVITKADAKKGSVTNTAVAVSGDGTVRSEPASVTITVQKKQHKPPHHGHKPPHHGHQPPIPGQWPHHDGDLCHHFCSKV